MITVTKNWGCNLTMVKININGKFLTVNSTGVQRVAQELVVAIDKHLTAKSIFNDTYEIQIIAPKRIMTQLALNKIKVIHKGIFSNIFKNSLWEQITLPFLTRGTAVLSLCNIAPLFLKNAIVMIHDAQVYTSPESYSWKFRAWYKFSLPLIGRFAKKIITVSEYSKKELIKYGVAKEEKIAVIHNGCDHILRIDPDDSIIDQHNLRGKKYCIAQSNTQKHKNIKVLLKAFESEALASITLVLYGSAKQSEFENMGYNVPNNVLFVGRISNGELRSLITHAVATLTPSTTEGFGLQPLEGMALGTPAIVAPCGALPEVCAEIAIYANENLPDEWENAILDLSNNPILRSEMSNLGKMNSQKFTWESSSKILLTKLVEKT